MECEQECIAIILLCLNHDHSEHKQKADVHGCSYWSMATFMTTSHWVAAQITHSVRDWPTIATNAHAWCCYYMVLPATIYLSPPWAGFLPGDHLRKSGPLAAKRTIHGSHSWSGGTIYSNTICRRWPGGPVVAGDHLRCGRSQKFTCTGVDSTHGTWSYATELPWQCQVSIVSLYIHTCVLITMIRRNVYVYTQ